MMVLAMRDGELSCFGTLLRVERGELQATDAARMLALSPMTDLSVVGPAPRRGCCCPLIPQTWQAANHRYGDAFRGYVVAIVHAHYPDFGPTLAREYLAEQKHWIGSTNKPRVFPAGRAESMVADRRFDPGRVCAPAHDGEGIWLR